MKPFIVLALCCSFISSRATPLPFEFLDCDNPDVFEAVDTALKKYNGDSTSGNQFALYMVMEAKRTVSRLHKKKHVGIVYALLIRFVPSYSQNIASVTAKCLAKKVLKNKRNGLHGEIFVTMTSRDVLINGAVVLVNCLLMQGLDNRKLILLIKCILLVHSVFSFLWESYLSLSSVRFFRSVVIKKTWMLS